MTTKTSARKPWQRLLDTRSEYLDWQDFYVWVRSILEVETRIPDWLVEPVEDAEAQDWFDAALMLAHRHPPTIRTVEHADHCTKSGRLPNP